MTPPPTPAAALALYYDLLAARGGGVREVRAFFRSRGPDRAHSGYYTARAPFVRDTLAATERGASGVFVTVNPALGALAARGENRLAPAKRGGTTKDAEVERRHWLVVDLDPARPTGISATDAERAASHERARAVASHLRARGWPPPVVVDSGNGAHLYYPVDLPADDAGLVGRVLAALDAGFSDDAVHVDTSVANASRVMKAPGTWARKGDDAPDRPHRRAAFLQLPDWVGLPPDMWTVVPRRLLEAEAALAPTNAEAGVGAGAEDPALVRSALEAVASHFGRLPRPEWVRLTASVLKACGGDRALAEGILVGTLGEEEPGEYGPVLASTFDRIGPGTLFYFARLAGWERPDGRRGRTGRGRDRDRRPARTRSTEPPAPLGVCVADVEAEPVRWVWDRWLAAGKVHNLDGDPGTGKSTLYAYLAACFTAGVPWPDGTAVPEAARGGVVVVTAEDDVATTIRPRLEAAGADVSRVSVVSLVPTADGAGRMPVLPDDVGLLIGECRRVGARLLVVDPVTAYLGDVNTHRDSDVRGALAPLADAAERAGVAVLLVRHLNKATGGSALYRSGGSIAFSGLARVVLLAARVPDDPDRRGLAMTKNNLAPFPPTLGYHLESAGPLGVGRASWHGPIPLSADDLVRPPSAPAPTPAQDEAAEFLLDALADGPRRAREVYAEAEAAGVAEKTLKRAKARLGVGAEQRVDDDGDRAWWWVLPRGQGADGPAPGPLPRHSGDGGSRIAHDASVFAQGATGSAPCCDVAPCPPGGPLTPGLRPGQTVETPAGVGTVASLPEGGRVSVEVGGLPVSFPLADVSPLPPTPDPT